MNNFDVPALFWREGEGVTMCIVHIKNGEIYDPIIRANDLPPQFLINLNADKVLRYTTGDYSVIVGGVKHTHQHLLELYIEER